MSLDDDDATPYLLYLEDHIGDHELIWLKDVARSYRDRWWVPRHLRMVLICVEDLVDEVFELRDKVFDDEGRDMTLRDQRMSLSEFSRALEENMTAAKKEEEEKKR